MVPESDEDDEDWTKYADVGYASAYDPWADLVEVEDSNEEDEEFDEDFDDDFDEDELRPRDIPRCPSTTGIEHVIQIGTCDACLGRISGTRIGGGPLEDAGSRVRADALERDPDLVVNEDSEYCPFCEDLFVDVDIIATRIVESLNGIEFTKAQLGTHFSKEHVANEETLRTNFAAIGSRPLKASLTKAIQDAVLTKVPGMVWVKEKPEVMILIDTLTLGINVDIRALFLYGRYRKLSREIPQTRWPCRSCRGDGCEACDDTGQQYPASIQSLVCDPLVEALSASGDAFHGMGREDIDVCCLGQGRPFVAELKHPLKRTVDFESLMELINKQANGQIEITGLRISNRPEVARIKETKAEKSYTIRFTCDHAFSQEEAEARIMTLNGKELEQQTPQRVSHRRADKIRRRKVISLGDIQFEGNEVQFLVRCESGTYVKELVHSDNGRTTPSVAGVLEADCEVIWLVVEDIHAD
ncbi:MAG: tRNA pseudouridine(54/55) synthase Pus10 [Candidatus Thalassarchaeaceae archaeon]|nr:tRNA pseudouridine(54/55) synthase Pus10 [Candidatus Thalassarchaeaceae archaeon]